MEALIPILGAALLLWVCSGSRKDGKTDSRDLRIGRNTDGLYYIYDVESGEVLGTFPDRDAARDYLRDLQG